jgi:hypothetical protein
MKNFTLIALTLLAACGDDAGQNMLDAQDTVDAPGTPTERAVIVTPATNFTPGEPGSLAVVDIKTRSLVTSVAAPAGAINEDPVLRYEAGELLVVNRGSGNNITILNAETLELVAQIGTGASSNPQDVAVVGNKLFVPTLGNKGAVVLTRGSSTVEEIDLSADDPDGKPNCSSVQKVGDRLFVACGLLDDTMQFLPPRGPAKVYVLDASTFAIQSTLTLSTKNPIALMEQLPELAPNVGDLLLPTMDFSTGEGCIERIATSGTPSAAGCLVNNSVLGNFASRITLIGVTGGLVRSNILIPARLYAAVPDPVDFNKATMRSVVLDGGFLDPWETPDSQTISDVVMCPKSGVVVVADSRMGSSGLRVYAGSDEETTAPLPTTTRPLSTHGLVCY